MKVKETINGRLDDDISEDSALEMSLQITVSLIKHFKAVISVRIFHIFNSVLIYCFIKSVFIDLGYLSYLSEITLKLTKLSLIL